MQAINLENSQHRWPINNKLSPFELQDKVLCADMLQVYAALLNYTHSRCTSLILIFTAQQPEIRCSHSLWPVSY